MSAHTGGPWRVGFDHPAIKSGATERNPEAISITSLNTGMALGGVVALAYTPEDAALICAAPDLLAACEAFVQADANLHAIAAQCYAAIVKAKRGRP